MSRTLSVLSLLPLLAGAAAVAAPTEWTADAKHSVAAFGVKHLVIATVRGSLGPVSSKLVLDRENLSASSVEATVDVAGINTGNERRDAHLKSPDFFDAAKFPTLSFKSTKVEPAGAGKLKITGDLTMRGVTRPVVLDVEGPSAELKAFGATKVAFSATTRLNRKDFGLAWNKAVESTPVVGDEVTVTLDLEYDKVEPKAQTN